MADPSVLIFIVTPEGLFVSSILGNSLAGRNGLRDQFFLEQIIVFVGIRYKHLEYMYSR